MVRAIATGIPLALQRLEVTASPAAIATLEATSVPYAMTASIPDVERRLARLRIVLPVHRSRPGTRSPTERAAL